MNNPNITIMGSDFNIYGMMLFILFLLFAAGLWRAQRKGHLNWTDMITRDGTKVSTTKILQLVGGVVGTWIMVQLTMQGKLTWDLFAIYLGYVASIDGFSKLVMAKYGAAGSDDSAVPYRRRDQQDVDYNDDEDSDGGNQQRLRNGAAKASDN